MARKLKHQRRTYARKLKCFGLTLPQRMKLARAKVAGTFIFDAMQELGAKVLSTEPCCGDRCDISWVVAYELDGKKITTIGGDIQLPKPIN